MDRVGPVVHGSEADGPLDAAMLRRYGEDGFVVLTGVLGTEEVDEILAELELLRHDDALRSDERLVTEPGSTEVRSIFEVHRISELFRRLCSDSRLVEPARQILGSDVYIHQSRVNYKPGFRGRDFYWHSDFETWHAEDGMPAPRALSISLALTDNSPVNGPLLLLPGSHLKFVTGTGHTPPANHRRSLKDQTVGVPDERSLVDLAARGIVSFVGSPGDAVMFDCNCMHGSNGNITPFARSNLFVVYNSVHNTLDQPYAATEPRPQFLGARDFTPVGRGD